MAWQSHYNVGVLTISDRCSKGQTEDKSGPKLIQSVKEKLCDNDSVWNVTHQGIIPDEKDLNKFDDQIGYYQTETWSHKRKLAMGHIPYNPNSNKNKREASKTRKRKPDCIVSIAEAAPGTAPPAAAVA